METASSFGKSGKPAPVPSSAPLKDDDNEDNYKPFLTKPIGTPVPNNVRGDALFLGSGVHTQLRRETARTAASQQDGLTNNNGSSTVPAWDLGDTNISQHRNSRSGESNNNGDGKQQFPAFPSQNSPSMDQTSSGLPEGSKKGYLLPDKRGDGGTAMGEMTTPSHQKGLI